MFIGPLSIGVRIDVQLRWPLQGRTPHRRRTRAGIAIQHRLGATAQLQLEPDRIVIAAVVTHPATDTVQGQARIFDPGTPGPGIHMVDLKRARRTGPSAFAAKGAGASLQLDKWVPVLSERDDLFGAGLRTITTRRTQIVKPVLDGPRRPDHVGSPTQHARAEKGAPVGNCTHVLVTYVRLGNLLCRFVLTAIVA